MERESFMQEGIDGRRLFLWLKKRIIIIIASALAGAIFATGIYLIYAKISYGEPKYRAVREYYIYFNEDEDGNIQDYYNAYTWTDMLKTDPLILPVLDILGDKVTRQQVEEAVNATATTDIRLLHVEITTEDAALSDEISAAYDASLQAFGKTKTGFEKIELWKTDAAVEVKQENLSLNAALLGACLAGIAAFLFCLISYALEDVFYVEEDIRKKLFVWKNIPEQEFSCQTVGVLTREKSERWEQEFLANAEFLLKGKTSAAVLVQMPHGSKQKSEAGGKYEEAFDTLKKAAEFAGHGGGIFTVYSEETPDYEKLRQFDAVLVTVIWGEEKGRHLLHRLLQLQKQKVNVAGVVLIHAREEFLESYYGRKKGNRNPRRQ